MNTITSADWSNSGIPNMISLYMIWFRGKRRYQYHNKSDIVLKNTYLDTQKQNIKFMGEFGRGGLVGTGVKFGNCFDNSG